MIPLLWAIALNGNMARLLEQLSAIGFMGEAWLTRKGRSPYSSSAQYTQALRNLQQTYYLERRCFF